MTYVRFIKRGKKTIAWDLERAKLKIEFERAGITSCEVCLSGCTRDNFLGFAHLAKRRDLSSKDLHIVVLICNNCHDKIEYACEKWTGLSMRDFLQSVIDHRNESMQEYESFGTGIVKRVKS